MTALTTDAQANPLLPAGTPRRLDGAAELDVALVQVLDHLLALLLDNGDLLLLLHDQGVHVLEQLGELDHLLLDLLDGGVAVLDGAEDGPRLPAAVALHQGLLEDLGALGGVLDGGLDLLLGGVGPHDAVLAGHLVLRLLAEGRLDLLVALDGLLEPAVDAADLGRVLGLPALRVGLDRAHAVRQGAVQAHSLGREGVELPRRRGARRRVGVVERAVLQHPQLVQVALDLVDALVDVPALVQDRVGVAAAEAAGILSQGGHLDVAGRCRQCQ